MICCIRRPSQWHTVAENRGPNLYSELEVKKDMRGQQLHHK